MLKIRKMYSIFISTWLLKRCSNNVRYLKMILRLLALSCRDKEFTLTNIPIFIQFFLCGEKAHFLIHLSPLWTSSSHPFFEFYEDDDEKPWLFTKCHFFVTCLYSSKFPRLFLAQHFPRFCLFIPEFFLKNLVLESAMLSLIFWK